MEWKLTIPVVRRMLVVCLGDSRMEIDMTRYESGDGEWAVKIQGDDVFS